MMISLFEVKWFNSIHNVWITDYHYTNDNNPFVISTFPSDPESITKYKFTMSRLMAQDIHINLENILTIIHRQKNLFIPHFRIINISISLACNDNFVTGSFEVLLDQEED